MTARIFTIAASLFAISTGEGVVRGET